MVFFIMTLFLPVFLDTKKDFDIYNAKGQMSQTLGFFNKFHEVYIFSFFVNMSHGTPVIAILLPIYSFEQWL